MGKPTLAHHWRWDQAAATARDPPSAAPGERPTGLSAMAGEGARPVREGEMFEMPAALAGAAAEALAAFAPPPEAGPASPARSRPRKKRGASRDATAPCPCPLCRESPGHPDEAHHRDLRSLVRRLGEPQRRWVAAMEARRLGFGGTRLVARITGLDEKTVRRGRRELGTAFADVPPRRLRRRAGAKGGPERASAPPPRGAPTEG